jgi:hypothetical protein
VRASLYVVSFVISLDGPQLALAFAAVVLALLHLRVERVGRAREALWQRFLREPAKLTRGPALVRVRVHSDDGARVNLGTSTVASANSIGNSAELVCEGVTLRVVDGPKVRLRRGAKLSVTQVVGAERKLLRVVTTEHGAEQEFSFTLAPEHTLWLLATLPRDLDASTDASPFRGETEVEVEPLGERYQLMTQPPSKWISGCSYPIAAAIVLVAVPFALAGSSTAFVVAFTLGLLTLAGQHITLPEPPPTIDEGANTSPNAVRVETSANIERDDGEAPAAVDPADARSSREHH